MPRKTHIPNTKSTKNWDSGMWGFAISGEILELKTAFEGLKSLKSGKLRYLSEAEERGR